MKTNLMFATISLLLFVGLMAPGCDSVQETIDNLDAQSTCSDYCAKVYDCDNVVPTSDETDSCVTSCRNSLEDNCGNENQAAAVDKVEECVDKGCVDFLSCMVFDVAPECFGFVSE
jgi:hypothetical protein